MRPCGCGFGGESPRLRCRASETPSPVPARLRAPPDPARTPSTRYPDPDAARAACTSSILSSQIASRGRRKNRHAAGFHIAALVIDDQHRVEAPQKQRVGPFLPKSLFAALPSPGSPPCDRPREALATTRHEREMTASSPGRFPRTRRYKPECPTAEREMRSLLVALTRRASEHTINTAASAHSRSVRSSRSRRSPG